MEDILAPRSEPSRSPWMLGRVPETACSQPGYTKEDPTDHQFIATLDSYRDAGGLAPVQEVVALFKRCKGSDLTTLASLIAGKKVICFGWEARVWLPLFQFNRVDMTPHIGLGQVLAQLSSVFSAWELANWFAQPNPWLGDRAPAARLGWDLSAVLHAARADRFVVDGQDHPRTSVVTGGQDMDYAN
ncbi:hypothetical protein [Rhodoferax ferrireducens]|uniref:hypothetical protein n=1 Tax=Rhodoferax ferrireducens TaxID=192843 RepID=UPI003BB5BD95